MGCTPTKTKPNPVVRASRKPTRTSSYIIDDDKEMQVCVIEVSSHHSADNDKKASNNPDNLITK